MAVVFTQGQITGRGDLDIFLQNAAGNPTNAAEITYAIYYVDPVYPTAGEVEVLIPPDDRTPVNPAVGEYYASLLVPTSAVPGDYRIRWTIKETVSSPAQMVVQEWAVVAEGTIVGGVTYSASEQEMIDTLRMLLRDHCVGGEETVELDVNGERMVVRMDDLWETLQDSSQP